MWNQHGWTQTVLCLVLPKYVKHSKINTIYYHVYVESPKIKQVNKSGKQTHRHTKQTTGCQWRETGDEQVKTGVGGFSFTT